MAFDGGCRNAWLAGRSQNALLYRDSARGLPWEGAIEIARIDDAWPTHKSALWLAELLARDCDVWFDFAPICAEF
jgi:hypothetical protein